MKFTKMNTIRNFIYGWMIVVVGFTFAACSNLEDSAFKPTSTEESVIYAESFMDNLGQFKVVSVSGDQKWDYYSNGYAILSGYQGGVNYANEDWLISPAINLTNVEAAHFTFEHVARYFASVATEATVWVSEDYVTDSLPSAATWKQIKTNPFVDPGNWDFSPTEQISLTEFAGKKIRIAFKYVSTATKAGTWEIRNFIVKRGEAVVKNASIYSEPFSSGLGSFTKQNVLGDTTWYFESRGYAMMSGYVNSQNLANEDWLISPKIDLTEKTAANFSFDHVARYFGNLAAEATVWISENYEGGLPSTANWTQVVTNPFFDPGAWTFSNSQKISLTAYCGKKINIAFKYISTSTKAGSWEIKNFLVNDGEANGNQLLPYTVSEAVKSQTGAVAWVEGYIVGYAWPGTAFPYLFTADTCSQKSNILIADTTKGIYISKALSVQLPRGGLRNGLNLSTNKTMLGQKVKVYGTLSGNAGIAGLVNPSKYILQDGTIGTSSPQILFSETFSTNLGAFTQESKVGTQTWRWQSGNGASMSGFQSGNFANEDYLYSPAIDLTSATGAALTFDHNIAFGNDMRNNQTLWITIDNGTTWRQLTIPTFPAGNNNTFVNAGEINLDSYIGKTIKLAFKYTSSTTAAATWRVKNLQIYN